MSERRNDNQCNSEENVNISINEENKQYISKYSMMNRMNRIIICLVIIIWQCI